MRLLDFRQNARRAHQDSLITHPTDNCARRFHPKREARAPSQLLLASRWWWWCGIKSERAHIVTHFLYTTRRRVRAAPNNLREWEARADGCASEAPRAIAARGVLCMDVYIYVCGLRATHVGSQMRVVVLRGYSELPRNLLSFNGHIRLPTQLRWLRAHLATHNA